MKLLTEEWIAKAEADFTSAGREMRARKNPNFDDSCFHSQQCAEKYLKAFLQENAIPFDKTHKLIDLLEQIVPIDFEWEKLRLDLDELSGFAVVIRYPGESADKVTAADCLKRIKRIRAFIRSKLGLN